MPTHRRAAAGDLEPDIIGRLDDLRIGDDIRRDIEEFLVKLPADARHRYLDLIARG